MHTERSERIIWGAKLCFDFKKKSFKKPKFSEQEKWGWLDSNPFYSSTTQDGVIDTSEFTCVGEAWNKVILLLVNSSALYQWFESRL